MPFIPVSSALHVTTNTLFGCDKIIQILKMCCGPISMRLVSVSLFSPSTSTLATVTGSAVLPMDPSELAALRQSTRHLVLLPGAVSE